jgi:peptidoglycan lytic transglycosylase
MLWPLDASVIRRLTRTAFIAFGWPLLILLSALGLQAPLAARPAEAPKPIRTWTGVASWYGPRFQGRKTASGQPYDMFAPTAAHPWLPFGSLIRVVNLRTGHSQLVRINDRGPAVDDRELDVSFLAASRLGLLDRGLARVRIELLEEPPRP